jgi:hypothetical protein
MVLGPSTDAITLKGFMLQLRQPVGGDPSFGFHLGAESEVISDWWQVRAGTYLEPARRPGTWGRLHFTAGTEVKLFTLIWTWKASVAFDVADRYTNLCVGIGFWH